MVENREPIFDTFQVRYHTPAEINIEPAWEIMRAIIEAQIVQEIVRVQDSQSKMLIGWLMIHIMIFLDHSIRYRIPGRLSTEFQNLLNGKSLPIINSSYVSVNDVRKIVSALGESFFIAYIKTHIANYETEMATYKIFMSHGATNVSLFIRGSCKKTLESIYRAAVEIMGNGLSGASSSVDLSLIIQNQQPGVEISPSPVAVNPIFPNPSTSADHQITIPYAMTDVNDPDFYIEPNLVYTEISSGNKVDILMLEFIPTIEHKTILTAPPMCGKTRLMREIADRNLYPIQQLYINLENFSHSGQSNIYRYAARGIVESQNMNPSNLERIQAQLEIMDMQQKIYWHLDGWDAVEYNWRAQIATAINAIHNGVITTVDAEATIRTLTINHVSNWFSR